METMNRYGQLAQNHWQKHLPKRYETLKEPAEFFRDLGEQVQERVQELMEEARSRSTTDYLQNLQNLNTSQFEAEGLALRELALLDPNSTDNNA